jgi:RNA polymerase sigma-70 factor (ECF subfamily)
MLMTTEELAAVPVAKDGAETARRRAFEAVAKDALPTLYGMARRLAGEDAEDLVQECLLRACRSFGELREQGSRAAWMRSILLNVHRDRLRARDRRPQEVAVDDVESFSLYRTLADEDPFPYSDTMHADFLGTFSREDVHAVLGRLPDRYRVPLVLHYMDGYATKEIADMVRAPRGTVLAQLHRGRKLFERALWSYALDAGLLEGSDRDG